MEEDIKIENLKVYFNTKEGDVKAVDGIDLTLKRGNIIGIVGETGSGKSVLGLSILGLLAKNAKIEGNIFYNNKNLLTLKNQELRKIRGKEIALIPQNPETAFNPIYNVGSQISELFYYHNKEKKSKSKEKTIKILEKFSFKNSNKVYSSYGFQLSGGMKQRVLSAMGMALEPKWIIADEPTKGLDAIIRNQVYDVFKNLKENMGVSMILITHDLMLAKKLCDEVIVMYAGKILEKGSKEDIFENPKHPYTKGLIDAQPNKKLIPLDGVAPSLTNLPDGCRFHPRCKYKKKLCMEKEAKLYKVDSCEVRCFLYDRDNKST